ncbi:unnamed protein product [Porites evermanni]|uniref:Fibronectin type-III domain-containing protein n=1 Tax=Porites evermanni TaxID=104178 RepID=A0ABN8NGH0_9CNID|nr:unnamed protein product [Porites evermanni]
MPPKSSGGTVVSNYIVEHKTVKTEWSSANHESVNGTRFALPVKGSETYTVRVRAVNSLGLSEPSNVITIKLTESDVRSLANSNSSGSVRATYLFEGYLLLLAVFEAFA